MNLTTDSSISELRSELERKRKKAQELQLNTVDADEWASLNTLRWELEDLDKDIYLRQFVKNNDKIAKLLQIVQEGGSEAQKLVTTIEDVKQAIVAVRSKVKEASPMFTEISGFLDEVKETVDTISA